MFGYFQTMEATNSIPFLAIIQEQLINRQLAFKTILQEQENERQKIECEKRLLKAKEKANALAVKCAPDYIHSTKFKFVALIGTLHVGYCSSTEMIKKLICQYEMFLNSTNQEKFSADDAAFLLRDFFPTGFLFVKHIAI